MRHLCPPPILMKLCVGILHSKRRKSEAAFDSMVPFARAAGREISKIDPFGHFRKFTLTAIFIIFSGGFRFPDLIDLFYKVAGTVKIFNFCLIFPVYNWPAVQ